MQRIINKLIHPVDVYRNWHFQKTDLGYLFADKHRILVHSEPGLAMPSMQHLLKLMGINTVGHAKLLASLLNELRIGKVLVEKEVDLNLNIISRNDLMYSLNKYIDEKQTLEKMIIRKSGFLPYQIEDSKHFVVVQQIKIDTERAEKGFDDLLAKLVLREITQDEGKVIKTTLSPDALKHAIHPGQSDPAVAENARTLTWVPDRETGKPLLDPKIFEGTEEGQKKKLEGPVLGALIKFKKQYMAKPEADGDLGAEEARGLQTFQMGYMLNRIIDPSKNKPYLTQAEFNVMPYYQKVQLGYGTPNFIFAALQKFLVANGKAEKAGKITAYDVFEDPEIASLVIGCFQQQKGS